MKALWLQDKALSFRPDTPVPRPPEGEALIRVRKAGICNTDVELTRGNCSARAARSCSKAPTPET